MAPKITIAVPRRPRGVTSRIAASITPVFPSWKPTSNRLPASSQGWRLSATRPKTSASTTALRAMTSLRLYLSANTPHRGTRGSPKTNMSALRRPTHRGIAVWGSPIALRSNGRNATIWPTPIVSMTDAMQNSVRTVVQDCMMLAFS